MNLTDPRALPDAATPQPDEFRVVVSEDERGTLVVPHGELDIATAPDLEAVLASQTGYVVIDLRQLRFVDAAGLHVLIDAQQRSGQDGPEVGFIPGEAARRLIECASVPLRLTYVDPRAL